MTRLVAEAVQRDLGRQIGGRECRRGRWNAWRGRCREGGARWLHVAPARHRHVQRAHEFYHTLPYKPRKSFAPIGLVTEVPMTLVGRADFPPKKPKS